jgi:hypothetical protein
VRGLQIQEFGGRLPKENIILHVKESIWRLLKTPAFRNLLIADIVSDVGTFMQTVGEAWLMVSLNAGPMYVALTSAQKDKNAAQKVVETAEFELNRAIALGYAGQDPEYSALKDDISNLKKQLKGSEDTTSAISKLKARLDAFLKRKSDRRTSSTSEQAPKKAA